MKNKLLSILLSAALLFTVSASAPYVQAVEIEAAEQHYLVLADDFTSLGTWRKASRSGTFGNYVLEGLKSSTTEQAQAATVMDASYTLNVEKAGTYRLWINSLMQKNSSNSPKGSWELGVSVNGNKIDKVFGGETSITGFAWQDGGTVTLSAGENTINIIDTSRMYARFNALLLTSDTELIPSADYNELKVQIMPISTTIIVDDTDSDFSTTKTWNRSTYRAGYYGESYKSIQVAGNSGATATWSAAISKSGYYNIYVWHPNGSGAGSNLCTNAPYTIKHSGGEYTIEYNQATVGGEWCFLGSAPFVRGEEAKVELCTTGDLDNGGALMADAMKFDWVADFDPEGETTIIDGDDFVPSGYEGWSEETFSEAYEGKYWQTAQGDGGALLGASFYVSKEGGYRVRMYKPLGLNTADMTKGLDLTIDTRVYNVDLTSLEDGWNTVAFCKLDPSSPNVISVARSTGGSAFIDAIEFEYVGYDMYYTEFESGFEKDWSVEGFTANGSLAGNSGKAILDMGNNGRVNFEVSLSAQNGNGKFGLFLAGNEEDGYITLKYDTASQKFTFFDADKTVLAESEIIDNVTDGNAHIIKVLCDEPNICVYFDEEKLFEIEKDRTGDIGIFTEGVDVSVTMLGMDYAKSSMKGDYSVDLNDPKQTIWGLGIEIQSDSIGSGNNGLPEAYNSIPHDLTQEARHRLYSEMLTGFRFMRMAGGLYYRGTDEEGKHLRERWDTQNEELAELMEKSGIEGIDLEFWSPTPYFKASNSYIVNQEINTLKCFDTSWEYYGDEAKTREFLEDFANTIVEDIAYLRNEGLNITQFGIQNEPSYASTAYSHCYYSPEMYCKTAEVLYPIIKAAYPDMHIHADSLSGQNGEIGVALRNNPELLEYIDAWTYHSIGFDSNDQIDRAYYYNSNKGRDDIVVYNNEFEYLDNYTNDRRCINTAQSIMNWMTFENSPTWHWLHALKPIGNAEAGGYSLGFWRKPGDTSGADAYAHIKEGDWDYNYQNWNSIRGFLKYMDWNSVRYAVEEDTVRYDQRIMAWKTPDGKLVIALTNRSEEDSFQFNINTGLNANFSGYRYTPQGVNEIELGTREGSTISPTLPPLSIEFWVQEADETMTPANGVEISKTLLKLNIGKESVLSATVKPDDAANKNVIWSSSDSTVATVDENGNVTALKEGTTTITATAVSGNGKFKAECVVTVTGKQAGDLNDDGAVNNDDVTLLRKKLVGIEQITDDADITGDGDVDICDLVKLNNLKQ